METDQTKMYKYVLVRMRKDSSHLATRDVT